MNKLAATWGVAIANLIRACNTMDVGLASLVLLTAVRFSRDGDGFLQQWHGGMLPTAPRTRKMLADFQRGYSSCDSVTAGVVML